MGETTTTMTESHPRASAASSTGMRPGATSCAGRSGGFGRRSWEWDCAAESWWVHVRHAYALRVANVRVRSCAVRAVCRAVPWSVCAAAAAAGAVSKFSARRAAHASPKSEVRHVQGHGHGPWPTRVLRSSDDFTQYPSGSAASYCWWGRSYRGAVWPRTKKVMLLHTYLFHGHSADIGVSCIFGQSRAE